MRQKKIQKVMIPLLAAFFFLTGIHAQDIDAQYRRILENSDHLRNFDVSDISMNVRMIRQSPEEGIVEREMKVFRRDSDDSFISVTLAPESLKGQGVLRQDNNMWRYDPESDKFTHTALDDNYEGSDARNRDMRRPTRSEDYRIIAARQGNLGNFSVLILELEAVRDDIDFVRQILSIDNSSNLILKEESYGVSGVLMRTAYFTRYSQIGDKYYAVNTIYKDELIEGQQTQISIDGISVDNLPDSVFSRAYLESISR